MQPGLADGRSHPMSGASILPRSGPAFLLAAFLPHFLPFPAIPAELPERAPVPRLLRGSGDLAKPDLQRDVALPESGVPLPEPKPVPVPEQEHGPLQAAPATPPDPRSTMRPDPSGKMPKDEQACRKRLTELRVRYRESRAEADPAGCAMPYPLVVESLGAGIALQPEAHMNCTTAEAVARFVAETAAPAAKDIFGTPLASVDHASAYVCRPRAGTDKLSEHAFGNAFDIANFTLSDGTAVAVELAPPEKNGQFLNTVRKAACGPFKTVLGPGSNADHADHIHLDLAPRRNGGTICE